MNFLALLALLNSASACHPVTGDRILSDDLARAVPAFAGLAPGLPIGYSPAPGIRRVLREEELLRIARFNGIEATHIPAVCFVMPMVPVENATAVVAMREALGSPEIKLELVELQPKLAPSGKVVFPRSTLVPPPLGSKDQSVLWRGYIEYGIGRRYPIAAKVDISTTTTRVVAAANLTPGPAIAADALRLETVRVFPSATSSLVQTLEQVTGHTPRHLIQAGQAISAADLAALPVISKGDRVQVEVRNGPTHLSVEGEAETAGYVGQTVQIRNLSSGKRFPAKVESARLVVVLPKGGTR